MSANVKLVIKDKNKVVIATDEKYRDDELTADDVNFKFGRILDGEHYELSITRHDEDVVIELLDKHLDINETQV